MGKFEAFNMSILVGPRKLRRAKKNQPRRTWQWEAYPFSLPRVPGLRPSATSQYKRTLTSSPMQGQTHARCCEISPWNNESTLCRADAPFFTLPLGHYTIFGGFLNAPHSVPFRLGAATRPELINVMQSQPSKLCFHLRGCRSKNSGNIYHMHGGICTTPSPSTSSSANGPSFQNTVHREDTRLL